MDKGHRDDPMSRPAGRNPPQTPGNESRHPDSACSSMHVHAPLGPGVAASDVVARSSQSESGLGGEAHAAPARQVVARSSHSETGYCKSSDGAQESEGFSSDLKGVV